MGVGNQSKLGGGGGGQVSSDSDPANMSQQQHSVLNAFDFAAIDEMDPALCKFFKLVM
jgi:hypothetical protein